MVGAAIFGSAFGSCRITAAGGRAEIDAAPWKLEKSYGVRLFVLGAQFASNPFACDRLLVQTRAALVTDRVQHRLLPTCHKLLTLPPPRTTFAAMWHLESPGPNRTCESAATSVEAFPMSYDFELFTSRPFDLDPPLTSDTGAIRIDGPSHVEDEDLPDTHSGILGKRRQLFRIHLEGRFTSQDQSAIDHWLGEIVTRTKGVLIDPQSDTYQTPTKCGQLAPTKTQPDTSSWMSFWFEDGEAFYQHGFEEVLALSLRLMPEAAPRRYGTCEPLQGKIEAGDFTGLIAAFKTATDVSMKAATPFGDILPSIPCRKTFERYHPQHFIRRQFMLGHLSFELRPKIFDKPADRDRLLAFFEQLCVILDVVYAQIAQSSGGAWFWHGLPDCAPRTVCIGPAYQRVWPAFAQSARKIGLHHAMITTDRLGNMPPRPPQELIAPAQLPSYDRKTGGYRDTRDDPPINAPVFPFDYAFDLDRYIW